MGMKKIVFASVSHPAWYNHLIPFITYLQANYPEYDFHFHNLHEGTVYEDNVVVYGDWHVMPIGNVHAKRIVYMHDTPLIDCDVKPNGVILPSSKWDAEILENCGIHHDGYVPKPMFIPTVRSSNRFDLFINLTQPERKGHDLLINVLKKVSTSYKIGMILPKDLIPQFSEIRNHKITYYVTGTMSYEQVIELTASAKTLVFTSYDEGIGLPPIEASYLGLNVVISDARAHNEFVDGTKIPITDMKIVKHSVLNKHFLYQIWDDEYLYEVLESNRFEKGKIIDDTPFRIDKIGKTIMGYFE
jgi:glycosyltransferase involved in cell wall biosynthesis